MSKTKLFREKLSILNTEFVDFISSAIKDNPEYDLSPSLRDYLEHVKELDKMYSEPRPILVAKRVLPQPKKLENGMVQPAGQFNFAPKIEMPALKEPVKVPTLPSFSIAKSTSTPSQSRKRRQEPLDYDAMKSGKDDQEDDKPSKPQINEEKEKNVSSLFSGAGSGSTPFSFKSMQAEDKKKESENKPSPKKDTNGTPGLFGAGSTAPNPLFGGFVKPAGQLSFKGFGSNDKAVVEEKKDENEVSKNNSSSLFGSSSVAKVGEPFALKSFSSTTPQKKLEYPPTETSFDSSTNALPKPSSNSLFGNLLKPSANPTFTFQPLQPTPPKKPENAEGENENEDQPPPKFDAVKHDEPDAVFTTKCSLHNFTDGQYKKAGTGFIYIKNSDKGPQLLIRAATTIGNVLVNTYINDSFKAEKKDNNRIQFSYPSTEGVKTHLARVVDFKDAWDYFSGTKKP